MERSEMRAFVKNLVHALWENKEFQKLDRFYHKDVDGEYNNQKVTFEDLEQKARVFNQHMHNLKIEVLHLVIEKNKFALHAHQVFEVDHKEVRVPSMLFAHLEGDKIKSYSLKTRVPLDFS